MAIRRKTVVKTILLIGSGLLAFCLAIVVLFYVAFSPSRNEVARVASPSGNLIATVIEINGGATTSFGYEVRIARNGLNLGGSKVASLYGALRSQSAYGINIRWISNRSLRIEYLKAESAYLVPPGILAPDTQIILVPGISDQLAPPGGMFYNLQGRPRLGG